MKNLFELIQSTPNIQARECANKLNRPLNTIDKQIKKLIEMSLIERKGSKKTGGYVAKYAQTSSGHWEIRK
jgi:predicted transcriptional regulator